MKKPKPILTVIDFNKWKELEEASKKNEAEEYEDCPCCEGRCTVIPEDAFGNQYDEDDCLECGGSGNQIVVRELTKKDWIREVRSEARRYVKFTGTIPKLKIQ